MNYLIKTFGTSLVIFWWMIVGAHAEQTGISWEFNKENDSQGWTQLFGVSDLQVSDGSLQITASLWFPSIKGPAFSLPAEAYGIISLRMRVRAATSARIVWQTNNGTTGVISFPVNSDTLFHEYWIPVYNHEDWQGEIVLLSRLEISGTSEIIGQKTEIDYIRILSSGVKPQVDYFKPLRTILKPGESFPLSAGIKNSGDHAGAVVVELNIPSGIDLIEGLSQINISTLDAGATDSLAWTAIAQDTGRYALNLLVRTESGDSVEAVLPIHITNEYWRQDEFFLSAWSPPFAWSPPPLTDDVFDYYHKANFDIVLWVSPNDAAVAMVEKFNMKCLLIVTSLVGGDAYLRASDNLPPPDLTEEQLSNLDAVIEKYRENPTVIGYFIVDEPNAHAFPNLGKVVAYLREKDPQRLSFINLYPSTVSTSGLGCATYDEHVEKFLDIVKPELLSYDRYIFFKDHDGGEYFQNLAVIRKWAMRYDIPFCNIIQAIGTDVEPDLNWRTPNKAEHRWLVYSTLAYGARAIIWFHWHADWGVTGSPDREQIYASLQKTNAEIRILGPAMLKLKTTEVYHSLNLPWGAIPLPENTVLKSVSNNADLVCGFFKDETDSDCIFFMNKNYNDSVVAAITLNGMAEEIGYLDAETGQRVIIDHQDTPQGSTFNLTLRPGGGKVVFFENLTALYGQNPLQLPADYCLKQNYPNPFNPLTSIKYELPVVDNINLSIFNLLGQRVATLVSGKRAAGRYRVEWDASKCSSGLYFCRLQTEQGYTQTKKLILLK